MGFLKERYGMLLVNQVPKGTCKMCGRKHEPDMPHDKDSLVYQYKFYDENGHWPTWKDAMAHCTPEMQAAWVTALTERGVKIE